MTTDEEIASRVRAALAHVPDVSEKRMFGSIAFMVKGKLCISARAERIMYRIDPALHAAALKRTGCQPVIMKGRQYRGYVYVNTDVVKTKSALKYWVDLALNYNETIASPRQRNLSR